MTTMPVEETEAVKVARAIRAVLGQHLQQCYSDVLRDPLPPDIAALLQRLDDSSGPGTAGVALRLSGASPKWGAPIDHEIDSLTARQELRRKGKRICGLKGG